MKFRQIVLLAMVFCLVTVCGVSAYEAEIKKMSAIMAEKIAGTEKAKIAVVDFTDLQGDVTELGRFVAEEFSVALAGAGKGFKIVDRTHLKSIIKENKLSATGLIDPATARKLGKIVGVDALITGTLTAFGDSVRIAVKILDASSAEVIDATKGNIAKTQAIEELLGRIAAKETASNSGSLAKAKSYQKIIAKGFTFELQQCKRSGKSTTCYFLITSNNQDNNLILLAYASRMFDNIGNEYSAGGVQLGNKNSSHRVEKMLPGNIPTKASFSFDNIFSQANHIALLEIKTYYFNVQFRDVPFSD